MSLFIGNLSKNVDLRELQDVFFQFGKCKVDRRSGYAFVEFDEEYNADDAK
jgi:RNA recognition motif-containing protein